MKVLLVALNAKYVQSNLAVYALRTACLAYDIRCSIYESNINELPVSHLANIEAFQPDVLGFSCYIWNIDIISRLITDLRKILPQTVIVLGGPEVSEIPIEALGKYQPDYVISGPGEKAWPELLLALKEGSKIPQIVEKTVSIEQTAFPYLPKDDLKNHLVYYEASRGCANRCAYCLSSVDRKLEFRPLSLVFGDIKKLWEMGVSQIKFVDRTFNLDKKRTLAIWQHLLLNYPKGNFHFEIAADRLSDAEIDFLKKVPSGLFQMEIGVQSTFIPTLEAINRSTNSDILLNRLKELAEETRVLVYADLIAGLPLESYTRFLQSFRDVLATRPDQLQLGFLKLLPGTSLRAEASKWGIVYSDFPPYEVLKTDHISFSELQRLKGLEWTVDLFYNSGYFKETLKEIASSELGSFFMGLQDRLTKAGELGQKRKVESRFKFLNKEFPELSDWILLDFLKQGLSHTMPSWYKGDLYLESQRESKKVFNAEKRPVLLLRLTPSLEKRFQAKNLALVMGYPHIDRRCQEIIALK